MTDTLFFAVLSLLYSFVIATGGWLVLSPERRRAWAGKIRGRLQSLNQHLSLRLASALRRAAALPSASRSWGRALAATVKRAKWPLLSVLLLLAAPALLIHLLLPRTLDAYEDLAQAQDPVIRALLNGEQLVPPPPLPPEAFVTREAEAERMQIATAGREWAMLDADFRQRLLAVHQVMAAHGYQMVLIEGYRSPERQAMLARLGPDVTNADAWQSYHQYGLAADSAFYRNGRIVISEKDPWAKEGYRLYGQFAEAAGLTWGGRWQMMDLGHVELRRQGILRTAK